ncbi:MAG: glycosyltransferase family 4 protein [Pseudomonadota bacterium]
MTAPLTLGFLSPHSAYDRQAFSGTAFFAARALGRVPGVDLRILGHRPVSRLRRRLGRFVPVPGLDLDRIDLSGLDAVLGMVATRELAALADRTDIPLVHVTDATTGFLREYYRRAVPEAADTLERRVVRGAARTVYSSHYMADRARVEYGAEGPPRVSAVPFGVNLDTPPEALPDKPAPAPLKLLYIGTHWARKGGAIALAAVDALCARGVAAEITLVGSVPAEVTERPGVRIAGFLDKNDPAAAARLDRLLAEAHLFVLPTRADCTPMVVAEANTFGTPVLITETGGIGSLVTEGVNGRMLPVEAPPEAWAQAIAEMTADPGAWAAMSQASFAHARDRLSWQVWARDLARIAREAAA